MQISMTLGLTCDISMPSMFTFEVIPGIVYASDFHSNVVY